MSEVLPPVEKFGAVRLIRFGNPPHGILSARGATKLLSAFRDTLADSETRAIVICGSDPGVFIRHYDLQSIQRAAKAIREGLIDEVAFQSGDFAVLIDCIAQAPVPVIAAINGICMGGGFELALACDVRIVQRDVQHIGLPEARIDILPGGGGVARLTRLIGLSAATDIILRGRTFDAERAYCLGIVGDIADDAVAFALALGERLASRDPQAIRAIKSLIADTIDNTLSEAVAAERLAFARQVRDSDIALAGIDALLQSGTMLETAPES